MIRLTALLVGVSLAVPLAQRPTPPVRGLTGAAAVARAYDTILDADFDDIAAQLQVTCGGGFQNRLSTSEDAPAPVEVCRVLETLALWWEISLEPESRARDQRFLHTADRAIAAGDAWTRRAPERAEAWFYLGAAYGARTQFRVLRKERLAAAREGKRIKELLERALALDPDLHDTKFGVGLYRYYADVAPAALRMLRWALLLPGGDRIGGLRMLNDARDRGQLVRGEAEYQLHLIYLWYEKRPTEALGLVRGLQARYPRNPLFHHIEAELHDVYFHNAALSLEASTRLLALADSNRVNEAELASVRARLNMATQLSRLGERQQAIDLLRAISAERPSRPSGAVARAQTLLKTIRSRTDR